MHIQRVGNAFAKRRPRASSSERRRRTRMMAAASWRASTRPCSPCSTLALRCACAPRSRSSPGYSQAHPIVLPRHDLLCACACAVLDDGLVLVDPNRSELSMGGGTAVAHMPVALLPRSGRRYPSSQPTAAMPIEHFAARALASATRRRESPRYGTSRAVARTHGRPRARARFVPERAEMVDVNDTKPRSRRDAAPCGGARGSSRHPQ